MTSWLHRTAIGWTEKFISDPSCPYWDQELLAVLSLLDDAEQGSLTYCALLVAAVSLVRTLRERIKNVVVGDVGSVGVPIVVAIPEGPLLPLAVLVVRALNEPQQSLHCCAQSESAPYAVLIPLEPTEGQDRLRHMLMDAKPAMILCLPGNDSERLSEILKEMECSAEAQITSDGLFRPTQSMLVDFHQLALDAVQSNMQQEEGSLGQRLRDHVEGSNDRESLVQLILKCERRLDDSNESALDPHNRISHIVYTSGTTGIPKGCISSIRSLRHYLAVKNEAHEVSCDSTVLLASALSFDPCLSDILATLEAKATLVVAPRKTLIQNLPLVLQHLRVTHVLCTPTLWEMVHSAGVRPKDLPRLQVVALGGEPIPPHITKTWARERTALTVGSGIRLCSTYGVTEACVYQTFGDVWRGDESPGQNVGRPLRGLQVRICNENDQVALTDAAGASVGEIILYGEQIDEYSAYLNMGNLTREKFVKETSQAPNGETVTNHFYRSGDRGYIDPSTNEVHILGRIQGEDGMVKVNGVRVELGEIEAALIDDAIVTGCLAVDRALENGSKQIHAYCVLSLPCLCEMGIESNAEALESGLLLTVGSLLTLLRARCMKRVKAGVMPTAFVIIARLPLSPTGKRDRRKLPLLSNCIPLDSVHDTSEGRVEPLWEYGASGATVSQHVIDCLNLQPCQRSLLTTNTSFGMLGGDSLAATRVARSLYAHHHGIFNSRFLGGMYGVLDGPFAASNLLRSRTMGEYVDWLDSHGVCSSKNKEATNGSESILRVDTPNAVSAESEDVNGNDFDIRLYEALLEAATRGQSRVAMALLDHGVDLTIGDHGGRLSKVSDRNERKQKFRSSPLHLACSKGDPDLVQKLLKKGSKFNSPDAAGSFPIHLAATGISSNKNESSSQVNTATPKDEDERRLECVRLLLEAGAPLSMKDGNKQTVLHCAARAGHCKLLRYLMICWKDALGKDPIYDDDKNRKRNRFDWADNWCRTPVHWAVLNGKVEALQILLEGGCSPNPPMPKTNRQTSVAMESPMEICDRIYGDSEGIGMEMRRLLVAHMKDSGTEAH